MDPQQIHSTRGARLAADHREEDQLAEDQHAAHDVVHLAWFIRLVAFQKSLSSYGFLWYFQLRFIENH